MDASIKQKWVEALRSGDYEQGQNQLYDLESRYCCLGVLCLVMGAKFEEFDQYEEGFSSPILPVLNRKSLAADGDEVLSADACNLVALPSEQHTTLFQMNDAGKSFAEIADYIEANL